MDTVIKERIKTAAVLNEKLEVEADLAEKKREKDKLVADVCEEYRNMIEMQVQLHGLVFGV